ncbi:hypothetical protein Y032_0105g3652 [Ancylostoma ceylanicum]|uniref:Uncharacterized protein n=1 Tax=Ancylostoma ceylanicum TaxID=53326 RepID=A0A016TFA4_9BILA|nr:hypothetical protein Y032_0105g3652 [Ancylostoma ceylanicum]
MPETVPRGRLQGCLRWLWSRPQPIVVQLEAAPGRQQTTSQLNDRRLRPPAQLPPLLPPASYDDATSHDLRQPASHHRTQPAMQPDAVKKKICSCM